MDIFDIVIGSTCVLGSIYWFIWFITPTATGPEGIEGPGILMNRMAYLLASLFVFEGALDFFGILERTPLLSLIGGG